MTYSGPQASQKDAIRFWIQDTDPDNELLTDDEIQYLIDTWMPVRASVVFVAAMAAEVLAARFTAEVSISADGVSVSVSELSGKYQLLASKLRDQAKEEVAAGASPDLGGVMWDSAPDPSIKPLVFGVGFMDNYLVGRADYGDYDPGEPWYDDPGGG